MLKKVSLPQKATKKSCSKYIITEALNEEVPPYPQNVDKKTSFLIPSLTNEGCKITTQINVFFVDKFCLTEQDLFGIGVPHSI